MNGNLHHLYKSGVEFADYAADCTQSSYYWPPIGVDGVVELFSGDSRFLPSPLRNTHRLAG